MSYRIHAFWIARPEETLVQSPSRVSSERVNLRLIGCGSGTSSYYRGE